jgi:hypothetical protein
MGGFGEHGAGAHHDPGRTLDRPDENRLGVEGKAAGWRTLRALADTDSRLDPGHLDELMSRARRQTDLLEELRVRVTGQVISS